MSASAGFLTELDAHPRVPEDDLVRRFEADAARSAGNREAPPLSNDACPMLAAVIMQPKRSGSGSYEMCACRRDTL